MSEQPETPPASPMASSTASASDILADHWALRLAPAAARPYLRLIRIDRPIGTWLLLFPCWWSLSLAATAGDRPPDLRLILLFAIGALVMRGAGCTFNDMVDRKIDARVARTADRPIASGQISMIQAVLFLTVQLAIGLAVLWQLNDFAILIGAGSLALAVAYPFMKRFTYWPQAWLGLTFNWGALLGWAAVTGGVGTPALLLYAAGIAWTLGYDTIYAHQDKEDDALAGVKSTALKLGKQTKAWLCFFYASALLFMGITGASVGIDWPFYASLGGVAIHFIWQVVTLDIDDPAGCLLRFKSNRYVGWILLIGIIAAGMVV